MRTLIKWSERLLVVGLLVACVAVSPVGTQAAVVIFGSNGGAPKAITVDASGNLNVVLASSASATPQFARLGLGQAADALVPLSIFTLSTNAAQQVKPSDTLLNNSKLSSPPLRLIAVYDSDPTAGITASTSVSDLVYTVSGSGPNGYLEIRLDDRQPFRFQYGSGQATAIATVGSFLTARIGTNNETAADWAFSIRDIEGNGTHRDLVFEDGASNMSFHIRNTTNLVDFVKGVYVRNNTAVGSVSFQVDRITSQTGDLILSKTEGGSTLFQLLFDGHVNAAKGYQTNGVDALVGVCANSAVSSDITATNTKTYFTVNCKVPANSLSNGTSIKFNVRGTYSGNATDTMTMTVEACQVSGCASGTKVTMGTTSALTLTAVSNQGWEIDEQTGVIGIGGSGAWESNGKAIYETAGTTAVIDWMPNTAPQTIDTTVDEYISVSITFSTNSGNNHAIIRTLRGQIQ